MHVEIASGRVRQESCVRTSRVRIEIAAHGFEIVAVGADEKHSVHTTGKVHVENILDLRGALSLGYRGEEPGEKKATGCRCGDTAPHHFEKFATTVIFHASALRDRSIFTFAILESSP